MTVTVNHDEAAKLVVQGAGRAAALVGRLDAQTVTAVRADLYGLVDDGEGDLLLDVSLAEVADSVGLGLLVAAHHRTRVCGRRLVLLDVPDRLDRLIRHTRLQRVLHRESKRVAHAG